MQGKLFLKFLKSQSLSLFIILISALSHGINLNGYPAFVEDEGTYISQAWSILNQNSLSPYTYWYDHSPAGWIIIAIWSMLTGGFFTFGTSVESGRVLMLLFQIVSSLLLYKTLKNITNNTYPSFIGVLLYNLTPLGIIFHRRVLLDNIMNFWVITALYFLSKSVKLSNTLFAALAIGLSVLSKEVATLFFPAFVILLYNISPPDNRRFNVGLFISIALATIAIYPIFALIKGEFFIYGSFLGGQHPHVSLLETLNWQIQREGGFFLSGESSFMTALNQTWIVHHGLTLLLLGTLSVLINTALLKNTWNFSSGLLGITYLLYLIRGGEISDWYILPAISIFSVNISLLINYILQLNKLHKNLQLLRVASISIVFILLLSIPKSLYLFKSHQTAGQLQALRWAKDNLPPNSLTLIDNFAFVDLNAKLLNKNSKAHSAHYYWKADRDPQIRDGLLNNSWGSIDYLLLTPAFITTVNNEGLEIAKQAIANSYEMITFNSKEDPHSYYPVQIRKINSEE